MGRLFFLMMPPSAVQNQKQQSAGQKEGAQPQQVIAHRGERDKPQPQRIAAEIIRSKFEALKGKVRLPKA